MSCENDVNRLSRLVSRLSAGIGQLANKRGFYAGLSLGGMGLVGAGLVALARRRSDQGRQRPSGSRSPLIDPKRVPQLPARSKIAPTRSLSSAERCEQCQTPVQGKQGPWYAIAGRQYCQDCAPAAARQANVDLVSPVGQAGAQGGNGAWAQPFDRLRNRSWGAGERFISSAPPHPRSSALDYLPPENRVETRLIESRIGLNLGNANEPALFVVDKGYVLVRPDGSDTGLALTPNLKAETGAGGKAVIREDTSQWWITHIPSGRTVVGQPYDNLEEAHFLGNILAQMDWTRDETEFTTADYRRASATVSFFNQTLAEAKKDAGQSNRSTRAGIAGPVQTVQTGSIGTRRLPEHESFEGKLVADGYGGISRVIEDNGDRLFLIDSLGKRYEVYRNEARTPDESDFEMCRVAMSFDPAKQPEASCGTCRRSTKETGAGEMWYKMGWKAFCGSCATEYAANEGYIKEEEIDENLEPMT